MADDRRDLHEYRTIFSEDTVRHPSNIGKLGVVLDANDETSSEFSDSEDEKLREGHVLVAWYPKGKQEEILEKKLEIVDRSLLPGDVIRWKGQAKNSQKGFVQNVTVSVDLKVTGTPYVIKDINCKDLLPLLTFAEDSMVVLDGWCGVIVDHSMRLTLRMKNGARCVVEAELAKEFVDCTDQRDEESPFYFVGFYSGQQVSAHPRVFKEAKWISGSRPIFPSTASRARAIVEECSVNSVEVNWQFCRTAEVGENVETPDTEVTEDKLSRMVILDHFKEATIQIGDKALHILTEDDVKSLTEQIDPMSVFDALCKTETATKVKDRKSNKKSDSATTPSGSEESADDEDSDFDNETKSVGNTSTSTRPRGGDTTRPTASTSQARSHAARRRRPLQRKKKKPQVQVNLKVCEKVCVEIQRTSTMISVLWQDGSVDANLHSTSFTPVLHLDELEFFPGDFVLDQRARENVNVSDTLGCVVTANAQDRTCSVRWLETDGDKVVSSYIEDDVTVYDIADHPDFHFRPGDCVIHLSGSKMQEEAAAVSQNGISSAGQVISVTTEGNVKVIWSNGDIVAVPPQQLFIISKDEDEDIGDDSSSGDSSGEWETASDDSNESIEEPFELNLNPIEDIIMRSLAALSNSPTRDDESQNTRNDEGDNDVDNEILDRNDENEKSESEIVDDESLPGPSHACSKQTDIGDKFQMLESIPQGHHFIKTAYQPSNQRQFMSVVQKEIALLNSSLPDGILVRSYENRMDLLSVLIVGPPGTPYEDGLFSFDIQLPSTYPRAPPTFHYISYCAARLNPNLYENGKVCVSLLGTWSGKGTEKWTNTSNVLQVLLSIQGLILCDEPYYNEAGFEKHRGSVEGHDNSRLYNEMAIIKLLQSTEAMIGRPPQAFVEECKIHFAKYGPRMIYRLANLLIKNRPEEFANFKFSWSVPDEEIQSLKFPLLPLSKGFFVSVSRSLERLYQLLILNNKKSSCIQGKL